jgi:glutaredoxin
MTFAAAQAVPVLGPARNGGGSLNPKYVRMYTRVGCEDSSAARDFLREQGVPFEEVDIDKSPRALAFVMSVNEGKQRTPTFDVDEHTFHCSPFDPRNLVRELGFELTRSACKSTETKIKE